MDAPYPENGKCCFCGGEYTHWGNSPQPIVDKSAVVFRCCDKCNEEIVVPRRLYDNKMKAIRNRERRARRKLAAQGYTLKKSRAKSMSADDCGGYRIVDTQFNRIEAGENFDLTLEEVEQFAADE